eukprot:gene2346-17983_t
MDLPNRHQVRDGQTKLDSTQERALKIMIALSEHYQWQKNGTARQKVTQEMEQLVQEFEETHNRVQEYLDERRDSESSKTAGSYNPREDRKVSLGAPRFNQETYLPFQEAKFDSSQFHNNSERQELQHKSTNVGVGAKRSQFPMTPEEHSQQLQQSVRFGGDHRRSERYSHEESLGQDMWRQLQRVAIPVFSGDKRKYENWKAAFLACIDRAPATPEYKLLQLRQYLSGVALEAIENLGFSGAAYEAAKDRLERKFGGKRREIAIHLEDMDNFKPVRDGCSKDIEKFADLLDVLVVNLLESGRHDELGNGSLYIKLLKKLPETLLTQYNRWIFENRRRECVETLKMWVIQESEFYTVARETVHGVSSERRNSRSRNLAGEKKTTFFGATEELTQVNRFQVGRSGVTGGKYGKQRLCKVCNGRHGVWACDAFRNMDIRQRWNVAKHFKLCFRCLGDDHSGSKCTRSRVCGIRGCQETHNKLLHSMGNRITGKQNSNKTRTPEAFNQQSVSSSSQQQLSSSVTEGERLQRNFATQTTMVCSKSDVKGATALRTIPVVLKNGCRRLKLNALLDDASTQTYVNEDVAAELGLNGTFETIKVNVLNGDCKSFQTMPVEFGLESVSGDVDIRVKALTAKRVTGNMKVIQWSHLADKWPHLKHIDFPDTGLRPIVDLLIGIDYLDMHYSYEEVRGQEGEPIARRTPLGWTCVGCPEGKKIPDTHFSKTTLFTTSRSDVDEINSTMKKFWDIDSAGTFTQTTVVSPDEKAALEKAENSFRFIDGRYEVGVPWKEDSYRMVNNHKMAMKRLQNTEKRLLKNPDVMKAYDEVIDQYLDKGYIRKVPVSEKQPDSKWYLPHFAILKPNKATTKIRIVFDASAKYEGTSLNDMIHSGPKLQRELFDVLLRFRCHPVAVVCDIAEMYLRIQIPEADRVYHRFLWRRCDQDRDPEEYEFSRVVFGITSSPFQAQFVIQKHAQLYRSEYPMASETALKSTYMDDSIDSVQDDEKGIQLYHQLAALWNKAGMHARKWLSNSPEVLSAIPVEDRASEIDLDNGELPTVKTLGILWRAKEDIFSFHSSPPEENQIITKRSFLRTIASLFDPLGFLAPFIVRAKVVMQEIWRQGFDWDDELDGEVKSKIQSWYSELHELSNLSVPRCLHTGKHKDVQSMQLHVFSDASEEAYGAVIYARYVYVDHAATTNIVAAKSRVAPLAAMSIPRMELMGAVTGLRLAVSYRVKLDSSYCTKTALQHIEEISPQALTNFIKFMMKKDYSAYRKGGLTFASRLGHVPCLSTVHDFDCLGINTHISIHGGPLENSKGWTKDDGVNSDRHMFRYHSLFVSALTASGFATFCVPVFIIDGRYEVGVPWKEDSYRMVNNHKMAMKRLQNTEKRLLKNPDVMKAYDEVIDQYLDKGYIRKVPVSEKQPDSKWYLPHFAILKPNKATTKIRIVFDASAKYEGTSLNDMIHSGPKLQRELFDVLLRFRCHPVAVVCDIAEMYLRIQIPEADRVYHRFLWRRCDQDRDPEEYEFSRVVFGITSSPFQAQFVIQKHAQLYRSEYPMASETALKSTYMDDSIDSVQDDEKGIQLYHQLAALWNKAGMHARKWLSNSPEVLSVIPVEDRASEIDLDNGELPTVKTLGILWRAKEDIFSFHSSPPEENQIITKRSFLRTIASLFDPLGFLAPFIVRAKVVMQEIWRQGFDWDDELDGEVKSKIQSWYSELHELSNLSVPRCLHTGKHKDVQSMQLHVFSDASEEAYGAVIYASKVTCCTTGSYEHSKDGTNGSSHRTSIGGIGSECNASVSEASQILV